MRKRYGAIWIKRILFFASFLIWGSILITPSLPSIVEGKTAKTGEISKGEIRRAVVRYLMSNAPWKNAEVRVREVRIPESVVLPSQQHDLSIRVPSNTRYLGHTPVELILAGENGTKRFWASAYLEVLHPVVVTKKPLTRNQIISADDVSLEKRDLAKIPPGVVTDLYRVIGKRLKRTLGVGTILRRTMLDSPPVVKRGDVVKLFIETENLEITALGRVEQRGGIGDTIRVVNLDSKRRVYGQVVDRQTVRVRY
jgi:flagella basal body P-ring formation protein FlgA